MRIERIMRAVVWHALKMFDTHADDSLLRREKAQGKKRRIELSGAFAHVARRGINHHFAVALLNIEYLNGMQQA